MKKISEGTLVPLSLVLTIAGGAFWISSVYSMAATNSKEIQMLRDKQDQYYEEIQKVDERLSRIEGKLGINLNTAYKNR